MVAKAVLGLVEVLPGRAVGLPPASLSGEAAASLSGADSLLVAYVGEAPSAAFELAEVPARVGRRPTMLQLLIVVVLGF